MEAVRRWNSRRRSPSVRALRDAGPPFRWLVVGGVVAILAVVALFLVGIRDTRQLLIVPFAVFVAVCAADRRGWLVRMATAELALRQRERWTWGRLPIEPIAAEAWLSSHADAPADVRATVMTMAGRVGDARVLLDEAAPADPLEAVRLARLRILFAAQAAGDHSIVDPLATLERAPEFDAVPAAEQRYQRLSLAWSIAWLRIKDREPWRDDYGEAIRPLAPFHVPLRYQIFHVVQQYALPIAYVGALLIVWGLGLL